MDNKILYTSIDGAIKAHAEDYSFNIESELFQQLTPEQQKMWRKEIEHAVLSGAYSGLDLARDERYEENKKEDSVIEDLKEAARKYEQTRNDLDVVSDNQMVERAFKAGANWQKQQMMKDAVEGYIERDKGGQLILGRTNLGAGDEFMLLDAFTFHNIKCGDRRKAKIMIVIKED